MKTSILRSEDVTGEEYVKRITVTDSISGAARIAGKYIISLIDSEIFDQN